jgi:hypothetical protein
MSISFELAPEIEQVLRRNGADLNGEAREAYLVELYRQHRISQRRLAAALGSSRVEVDSMLNNSRSGKFITRYECNSEQKVTEATKKSGSVQTFLLLARGASGGTLCRDERDLSMRCRPAPSRLGSRIPFVCFVTFCSKIVRTGQDEPRVFVDDFHRGEVAQ